MYMEVKNIRNFVVIAHIDHGKSTLADRMLEITNTIEKRKMREQVLDQMELEREKGITIKMQPVRMVYHANRGSNAKIEEEYILNLIDTPGHIDFSYEVSRALQAVEGAILLVDATQGVEAQTITNVLMAKSLGLKVIPVLNKIDLASAMIDESKKELEDLLKCKGDEVLQVSAKTGEGVEELLSRVIEVVPPPKYEYADKSRALVFDFSYSLHRGVIVYVRVTDGEIKKGDELAFAGSGEKFIVHEVGTFNPQEETREKLSPGEIGYIVTNIKKPAMGTVGDSIISPKNPLPALPGYMQPKPVVFASVYPTSADNFNNLKHALEILHLSDSSLNFEEESSGALGRGYRCGFLGMLHLEIITERLKREFYLEFVVAQPTITYTVKLLNGEQVNVYSPAVFPEEHLIKTIFEPWIEVNIITPPDRLGGILQIIYDHEARVSLTEQFGEARNILKAEMPLRELMRGLFEEIKSASAGYASLNYKIIGMREAPKGWITRLDILVADELVPALSRITSRKRIEREAEELVEKLKNLVPRALFVIKIQARGMGRIIASRTISALKKDVTGYLYGGDRTRKMKLWAKQKRGKSRMKESGKVNIPNDVFVKMMQ